MSFNVKSPMSLVYGTILLVVLFTILNTTLPMINSQLGWFAGNNSGLPFISFFASNGLIILGIMAGVLFGVFTIVGLKGLGGKK